MMVVTAICVFLGVTPLLGAFVAGMSASVVTEDRSGGREAIKNFSFAFFIPVYFAIVGLRLDLVKHFDLLFFLFFLVFACAIKALSVYAGARLAGETRFASTNLAVAMNARGGPGIVLASVAFDAGIINESFYAALVMLAVVTSLFAGSWLDRVVRDGRMPRDPEEAAPAPVRAAPAAKAMT
jgi:Kef-type K+ transport system membrane component KefB